MKESWKILALVTFMSFAFFLASEVYPTIIQQVRIEFGLSYVDAALPMAISDFSGIFLPLLTGIFVLRWGSRRVGALGIFLSVSGGIIACSAISFGWLILGRFLLGTGGILMLVFSFSTISEFFSKENIGIAMGIKSLGMPFATLIAFNLLPLLLINNSWRTEIAVSTIPLFFCALWFFFFFRTTPSAMNQNVELNCLYNRKMWKVGLVHCFHCMAFISYITWAGAFFVEKSVPYNLAFLLSSLTMVITIPLSPVFGALSDKSGDRKKFIASALLLRIIAFAAIPFVTFPLLLVPVTLLCLSSFITPQIFALSADICSKNMSGIGFGILLTCESIGSFSGPLIAGYLKDLFPSGYPSFFSMSLFSIVALFSLLTLRGR